MIGAARSGVYCAICWAGRSTAPALVELREDRFLCSGCAREAVELLVEHYGDVSPLVGLAEQSAPVPA